MHNHTDLSFDGTWPYQAKYFETAEGKMKATLMAFPLSWYMATLPGVTCTGILFQ